MLAKSFIAAGTLLSMAAAVPMQQLKREIIWETDVEMKYVTVDVTTTIWLAPGETPPAAVASPAGNSPPGHYGHKHHSPHPHSPPETPAAPSAPATSPEPTYAVPSAPAAPETPSSPYVAPAPTTTTEAAAPSPPAYSPPPPAPSPSSPSSGGGAPSGTTYTGDLTYYTPGMGSCGVTNTDSESIVALAEDMMTAAQVGGNPNENPLCGKSITISWQGKTATATIMDTCPGCANGGLDLTPTLFQEFAPLGEGRLTGMKWWYN